MAGHSDRTMPEKALFFLVDCQFSIFGCRERSFQQAQKLVKKCWMYTIQIRLLTIFLERCMEAIKLAVDSSYTMLSQA